MMSFRFYYLILSVSQVRRVQYMVPTNVAYTGHFKYDCGADCFNITSEVDQITKLRCILQHRRLNPLSDI